MANVNEGDLRSLGPWPAGANNLAAETSVPSASFREGININVSDDGKVSRRDGATLVMAVADAENLIGYGSRGFYVHAGSLVAFDAAGTYHNAIATGLDAEGMIAHCLVEPDIFLSDGRASIRISPDNTISPWSLASPPAPTLLMVESGSLPKGRYMVALTVKLPSGEESGLGEALVVDLLDDGKITLSMPTSVSPNRWAVYMTKPNGSDFLLMGVMPGAVASLDVSKQKLGRPCATENVDPMPAGTFAAMWNGRLLVGAGREVYWSEPMQYGYTQLAYNYLTLSEDVTMVAAVDTAGGFFVGQGSRTYFVRGADPADAALIETYASGVVPGSVTYVPGATLAMDNPPTQMVPMWTATNGVFCVGLPDGSVLPLSEPRYVARVGDQAAAAFVQRAGVSRYIATVRNPTDNDFAVGDSISAEVIRNTPSGT